MFTKGDPLEISTVIASVAIPSLVAILITLAQSLLYPNHSKLNYFQSKMFPQV